MAAMADRYAGPAALRIEDITFALVDVSLETHTSHGTYRWDGHGSTNDIRALDVQGKGGALTLPNGREGQMHVAAAEPDTTRGGVLLHLHGGGPAPY